MASRLNHEEFVGNISIQELKQKKATKDQLKYIAREFDIPFPSDIRKDDLMILILAHLGEDKESAIRQNNPPGDINLALAVETVKLNALKLKLEFEEKQRQHEKEQAEMALQHRQYEAEQRKFEAEQADKQRQHELTLAQLKNEAPPTPVHLSKHLPILPQFLEEDPDTFFTQFEARATGLGIDKKDWAMLLQAKLTGKALIVVNGLEHNNDYATMKQGLLHAYSITSESCRQKFRNLLKNNHQTDKLRAFKKWLQTASVTTFEELTNLMVLEEFKRRVPFSIKLHIDDKDETDLMKAAETADKYSLTHKALGDRKVESHVKSSAGYLGIGKTVESGAKSTLFCLFCKQPGHFIRNCPHPKCKVAKGSTTTKPIMTFSVAASNNLYKPFVTQGSVTTHHKERRPVKIVRDTGGSQSLLLKSSAPGIEGYYTGEKVTILDFHGPLAMPLAQIYLDCPLIQGKVIVAVCEKESLPISNCDFILSNDLVGGKVFPLLKTKDSPLNYDPTEELTSTQPLIFPVCAVTRSQTRKQAPLPPTPNSSLLTQINFNQLFSQKILIEAQREDSTISRLRSQVIPKDQITHYPSYYLQDNILMRVFRPKQLPDDAVWAEVHQIVLPCNLRQPVIEIAHEAFAEHLGITKTCGKILSEFYWPGIRKDVTSYVNTCHTCQVVGKPNQCIPPYPLQPIKVPTEPFTKIIIDIVGPLPKTKKGNQYILTIMDPTTRYPEAFPLKNITSRTIVSKLTTFFTTFGIPQEIQSNRGTNFTSDLFKAVTTALGITQTLSTAYHPQSQGALERCHQTLKSLLRTFCYEKDREWDETLPYMLFAIRETPHESLGISPFELLFGRKVRGPLRLIKDKLLNCHQVLRYLKDYLVSSA